jgi:hypothetical protein
MAKYIDEEAIQETSKNPSLLLPITISLIFNGPMTSYIFTKIDIKPPPATESLHTYLEQEPNIKQKIGKLSPEMQALAWWSLWTSFDSQLQRSSSGFLVNQPEPLSKRKVVAFMQDKLGLKPPKIL